MGNARNLEPQESHKKDLDYIGNTHQIKSYQQDDVDEQHISPSVQETSPRSDSHEFNAVRKVKLKIGDALLLILLPSIVIQIAIYGGIYNNSALIGSIIGSAAITALLSLFSVWAVSKIMKKASITAVKIIGIVLGFGLYYGLRILEVLILG